MKSKGVFEVQVTRIEVIQGLLPRIYTHTIEEKVQEYQEAMAEGQEFPPITVWDKDGHYWLIDGMHRLIATKRLGKDTIKAEVVELENELEARILAIEKNVSHGIPLDKEEKRELARLLYADGVEIEKLRKLFRVSERTIYNWVAGVKRRAKDEELKRQALELRRQGLTQEEVAKRLGVGRRTISDWERESLAEPEKIADSTKNLLTPDGTPTQEGFEPDPAVLQKYGLELKR
jgi:ParB-like chromosome segregation protein Spo0J